MSDVPQLLLASLNPSTRKQAEQGLATCSTQTSFLLSLLRIALDSSQDRSVRLAGSVYLKNTIKSRWEDEESPIQEADKAALRADLVPAMIALSTVADKPLRAQIAEAISIMAWSDFPGRWPDLIDKLVGRLSNEDYQVNLSVLETAHSIFRPWRAETRSDGLFSTINYVLDRFAKTFLQLLSHTANVLFSPSFQGDVGLVAQTQKILIDLFFDLTCQDLPPDFEDSHVQFFGPQGLFLTFLSWNPPSLATEPDDTTPSLPSQIKTGILEIAELYTKLYPEVLQNSGSVELFVTAIWELLGGGKLPGVSDDHLVAQALRFLSTTIRIGHYKQHFSDKRMISVLVEGVVVPNIGLRDHDIEQFEDDPLEFIRLDLSVASTSVGTIGGTSSEAVTRRQAAADVLKAFVSSGLEEETTEIVGSLIQKGLETYSSNPSENWQSKDVAVYLLGAIATRGSTIAQGVTSTNSRINVVEFFSNNVFQDLRAPEGTVHPILQVDAIRFLNTFRNQLTKDQLLTVLPHLAQHLRSANYVACTYAAVAMERILFIRRGNVVLFAPEDIQPFSAELIDTVLTKLESAGSPEKVAENDFLMRCIMRIIFTARQTLATAAYDRILQRLVGILGVTSKNPSNPNFDQYLFESLSGLMRFVAAANPRTIPVFEQQLFGPFTFILQQDIDQYIPYVFQVLGQMLELHASSIPDEYRPLLPFLLTPAGWQQKGSIPGLVKLLKAFLTRDSAQLVETGQYTAILAVVQQRLIPSKINDGWGFELLQAVVENIPPQNLRQYLPAVIVNLLNRMQTSKTDKYVHHFVYFLTFVMGINANGHSPDYLIGIVEQIQGGLWSQIMTNFVIPQVPLTVPKDQKVVAVGIVRMLVESEVMRKPELVNIWTQALAGLYRLFANPQHLAKKSVGGEDPDASLTAIDHEEQNAGYQAAYSRLAASESVAVDPVGYVNDPRELLETELGRLSSQGAFGGNLGSMVNEARALASQPLEK